MLELTKISISSFFFCFLLFYFSFFLLNTPFFYRLCVLLGRVEWREDLEISTQRSQPGSAKTNFCISFYFSFFFANYFFLLWTLCTAGKRKWHKDSEISTQKGWNGIKLQRSRHESARTGTKISAYSFFMLSLLFLFFFTNYFFSSFCILLGRLNRRDSGTG